MREGTGGEGVCTFMTATFQSLAFKISFFCAVSPWGRATGFCSTSGSVLLCLINGLQSRFSPLHSVLWILGLAFIKAAWALQWNCSSLLPCQKKGQGHFSAALLSPHTLKNPRTSFTQRSFQLTMYVFNLAHMVIHGQVRRAHFPFSFLYFFFFFLFLLSW